MRTVNLGDRSYRILAAPRGLDWRAWAERTDSGAPFGIECAGASEEDAVQRLSRWLEWQHEHTAALDSLQQAERVYHRMVAVSAFGAVLDSTSPALQQEALDAVESARVRLDDIRGRRPN